jgi:signal transduction histidine kinase
MKSIRRAIITVFVFLAASATAQTASDWRVFRASDGLPETAISSLTVGPRGLVWLRHPNQPWISRLDGYEVSAIPAPSSFQGIVREGPSGQICSIDNGFLKFFSPQNSIWETKLSFSNRTNIPVFEAERDDLAWDAIPLKQDQVMLLTGSALSVLSFQANGKVVTNEIIRASKTGLVIFKGMVSSQDNNLWLWGTHGVAHINGPLREITTNSSYDEFLLPKDLKPHPGGLSSPVSDTLGGITFVARDEDYHSPYILSFDGHNWLALTNCPSGFFKAWRPSTGGFTCTTRTQVFSLQSVTHQWQPVSTPPVNTIYDAIPLTNDVLLLATSEGLLRSSPSLWQTIQKLDDGETNRIRSFIASGNKVLIISKTNLIVLGQDSAISVLLPEPVSHSIGTILAGTKGNAYLGNNYQIWSFDSSTLSFNSLPIPEHFKAQLLAILPDGKLFAEVRSDNIDIHDNHFETFDGARWKPFSPKPPDIWMSGGVRLCHATTNGSLLLYGDRGLARFESNVWQIVSVTNSHLSENPSCMLEFAAGIVWLGFGDSLVQFDGRSWTTLRAGFHEIHDMIRASDGSIWLAADNGIHRYKNGTWLDNSTEEGLTISAVSSVRETADHFIYIATAQGIEVFHPQFDNAPPHTFTQSTGGSKTSFHEGDVVGFEFSAKDRWKLTPPDRMLFSYRLDSQPWSAYQEQRTATFLDLTAGNHHIEARSMDRNWNVDPAPVKFDFSIVVPWYRESRLVFISAMGLAAALFFAAIALDRHRRLVKSFAEVEAVVTLRTEQLNLANRELFHSQKMNALGTLAAGIAHDFNNILSIIKGSAQIIEDNLDDPEKIKTRAGRIRTVVEQGTGIVQAMLGFSRSSGQSPAPCDINAAVQETITLLGDRFLREVSVHFEPCAEKLPQVETSKDFVQQVLINFIFNAADASASGQPITIKSGIAISLPDSMALKPSPAADIKGTSGYIQISVHDHGTGITPDVMPRIFEPFFTTKAMGTKRGTGLGLSMAYELAKQMNCGLVATSEPGKGSVFSLFIPIQNRPLESGGKTQSKSAGTGT